MRLVNIGNGNTVNDSRVISVVSPDSAPIKRLIQDARESGRAIDVSCGHRTRAVLITDSDHVILSALKPETVCARLNGQPAEEDTDEGDAE